MNKNRGVDYIGVTVTFVIHDGKGNFLLQKRSQLTRDEQGTWDVGGGALEFGEEWNHAVEREVEEEIGVKPLKVEFLKAFNALRENQGVKTHWIALVHAVQVDPSKVKINEPEKIDEIAWFTLELLPSPLHSKIKESLEAAKFAGFIS
ncbi:MAG: NUDIX domain-containing protein [bacterium]